MSEVCKSVLWSNPGLKEETYDSLNPFSVLRLLYDVSDGAFPIYLCDIV